MIKGILYFFMLICWIPAAGTSISGTVSGEDGSAIMYATVALPDGKGVVCDSAGRFSITGALSYPVILSVRAVNYLEKDVVVESPEDKLIIILQSKVCQLEGMVVTAGNALQSKTTVSAITIDKLAIEEKLPVSVTEILGKQAGFTQKTGYQAPLVLRGLSGKRLLILRNGNRRFSSYPSGFMSHTVNVYDLEKVEVEKGPASVKYGAGAIAGVINLIDKSPFKQKGLNSRLTLGYGSNNNERDIIGCGRWSDGALAVKSGFRYRSADVFRYSDGSAAKNSFYTDKDLFVSTGYAFAKGHQLLFTSDIHWGGPWGKPMGFNGTDFMLATTTKENNQNYSITGLFDGRGLIQDLEASVFYSNEKRNTERTYFTASGRDLSYHEKSFFRDHYYGTRISGNLRLIPDGNVHGGIEYYSFHLSAPVEATDYIEGLEFRNEVCQNARSGNAGVFVEGDWFVKDNIRIKSGIRYDEIRAFEGEVFGDEQSMERSSDIQALSGSAALLLYATDYPLFRMNVARSFRMPETMELFSDNYTSNGIIFGNPELKPEYCYSLDLCLNIKKAFLDVEVSPYIWLMDNMISKEEIFGQPGTNYAYINIGKARLWGGEVTVKVPFTGLFHFSDDMALSLGMAYVNGTDVTGEGYFDSGKPLDYIPPVNIKSDVSYHFTLKNTFKLSGSCETVFYSKQSRLPVGGYATPGYCMMGASVGIAAKKWTYTPALKIMVHNVLNTEYFTFQSYLPAQGRDVRIFLTMNF